MHGIATGIDIGEEYVTAVQVGGGLTSRRILAFARIPVNDGDLGEALGRLAGAIDLKNHSSRALIPQELVSFRNVVMPFSDAKKIRQALPFEAEGMLPYPVEDLMFDFVRTGDHSAGAVLAASVRKEDLALCLGFFQTNGIDPEILEVRGSPLASWVLDQPGTPDHFLALEAGRKKHTLVLCMRRRIALIRSFVTPPPLSAAGEDGEKVCTPPSDLPDEYPNRFLRILCSEVHRTLHAFLSSQGIGERPERLYFTGEPLKEPGVGDQLSRLLDMPAEPIDVTRDKRVRIEAAIAREWSPPLMNGALSLALMNPVKREGFNFRRNEFGRAKRYQQIREAAPKIGVFLFLILSLLGVDIAVDTYSLKREYQSLTDEIQTVFRQTLPHVTRIVDPVQQMRVAVEEMKRSSMSRPAGKPETPVLDLLRDISARIPPAIRAQVDRMVVDPETVRISGRTDAFNDVDRIKNELAGARIFGQVAITSANLDRTGKKVQFEITIERKR